MSMKKLYFIILVIFLNSFRSIVRQDKYHANLAFLTL